MIYKKIFFSYKFRKREYVVLEQTLFVRYYLVTVVVVGVSSSKVLCNLFRVEDSNSKSPNLSRLRVFRCASPGRFYTLAARGRQPLANEDNLMAGVQEIYYC